MTSDLSLALRLGVGLQFCHQSGVGWLDQDAAIGEKDGGNAAQAIVQALHHLCPVIIFFDVDLGIGYAEVGKDTLRPAAIATPGCRVHDDVFRG